MRWLPCFVVPAALALPPLFASSPPPDEADNFGIDAPVGFDARLDGSRVSLFMQRYGTGGTPWTTVIDKRGMVRFGDFTPSIEELKKLVEELRAEEIEVVEEEGGKQNGQ